MCHADWTLARSLSPRESSLWGYLTLAPLLRRQGYHVRAIVRSEASLAPLEPMLRATGVPPAAWQPRVVGDLAGASSTALTEALAGCDVVLHTGGPLTRDLGAAARGEVVTQWVEGTRNVIEAAARARTVGLALIST
jgi:nucleoside-diphosphate-sugar epimerase